MASNNLAGTRQVANNLSSGKIIESRSIIHEDQVESFATKHYG